jgi:tRNA-dihydrouridine synthase B
MTAKTARSVKIGPYELPSNVLLAPMAGVTDRPFRILCRRFGAGLAASEMLSADVRLWDTPKSRRRMDHSGEPGPRVVQIAGFDPAMMAEAARRNVDAGAQIIDINMGCPQKKSAIDWRGPPCCRMSRWWHEFYKVSCGPSMRPSR